MCYKQTTCLNVSRYLLTRCYNYNKINRVIIFIEVVKSKYLRIANLRILALLFIVIYILLLANNSLWWQDYITVGTYQFAYKLRHASAVTPAAPRPAPCIPYEPRKGPSDTVRSARLRILKRRKIVVTKKLQKLYKLSTIFNGHDKIGEMNSKYTW